MKKKTSSIIGAVFCIVVTIAIMIAYACMFLFTATSIAVKIIVGIVLAFLIGVSIYVLVERINEIRSGYYDDISKY